MEKFDIDVAVQVVRRLYDKHEKKVSLDGDMSLPRLPTIDRFKYEISQQKRANILSSQEPVFRGQKRVISLKDKFEAVTTAVLPVFFKRMRDADAPTSYLVAGKFCQSLADLHLMPIAGTSLRPRLLEVLNVKEDEFWSVMKGQAKRFIFHCLEEIMVRRGISYEDIEKCHLGGKGELDSLEFMLKNLYHPTAMEILSAAELAFDMDYDRVIPEFIQAYRQTRIVTTHRPLLK